jgi:hypothetical protein
VRSPSATVTVDVVVLGAGVDLANPWDIEARAAQRRHVGQQTQGRHADSG